MKRKYVRCSGCRRVMLGKVPMFGDGSEWHPIKHATISTGQPCSGNDRAATVVEQPTKSSRARMAKAGT